MELMKIWRVILGHWWPITIMSITAATIATLITYVLPPQYKATAVVLVRPEEAIELNASGDSKEILDYPLSHAAPIDAPSKTYIEIIQSRVSAERVVRELGLHLPEEYDGWWDEWKGKFKRFVKTTIRSTRHIFKYGRVIEVTPFEMAVEDVQENLEMEAKKNTYVFLITFGAGDPEDAAKVANELADILVEYISQEDALETDVNQMSLASELERSNATLTEARLALQQFKEGNETFLLSEEYSEQLKMISTLESSLEMIDIELAGLRETQGPASSELQQKIAERRQAEIALNGKLEAVKTHSEKEKQLNALQLAVDVSETNYKFIRTQYDDVLIAKSSQPNEIKLVSPATPPSYPSKPIKYYYGGAGLAMGLVVGVGWALGRESIQARLRSIDEVKQAFDVAVLATIPKIRVQRNRA